MKRPRLSALKSWSAGQLALLILAGILSVWVMGAMAFGLVSNLGPSETEARALPSASSSPGTLPQIQAPAVTAPPVNSTTPPVPTLIGGSGFSVSCNQPRGIARQSSASFDCSVRSRGGFSQAVAISCTNLPKGLNCDPNPSIVTPPPDGTGAFKINLTNYDVDPGKYSFKIVAGIPSVSAVFNFPFESSAPTPGPVASPPDPGRVDIQCATGSTTLIPGQSITYKCTYSSELYYGTVATSCTGTPGVTCDITPRTVTPRDGQPAEATLSLNVAADLSSAGTNQVIGVYGEPTGVAPRAVHKFTVDVPPPDYTLTCARKTAEVNVAESVQLKCQVTSSRGYVGPLHLKMLTIDTGGPVATVSPASVQVGANGNAEVTVTFDAAAAAGGSYGYALGVHADQNEVFTPSTGDNRHNSKLTVTVIAPSPSPSPSPESTTTTP